MREVEVFGAIQIDQHQPRAAEDIQYFDEHDAAEDEEQFSAKAGGQTDDQSRIKNEQLQAVADIGYRQQRVLVPADGHNGLDFSAVRITLGVHGGDGVIVAGTMDGVERCGSTFPDDISKRFIQSPVW